MSLTTAQLTSGGLNQLAGALLGNLSGAANPTVSYVAVGTGAGLLSSGLTNGTAYTSLAFQAGLPVGISVGQSLTIINGSSTQTVVATVTGNPGDTHITVGSFTANFSYPIGSGVLSTPSANDTQLQNEVFRNTVTAAVVGANPGEVLITLYIAPSDSPGFTFLEIGWFAGSASGTANSGILMARALYWYPHTTSDSANAQLDTTV